MSRDSGPRGVAVLGASGSIGAKALEVIRRHPDRFRLVAVAARSAVDVVAGAVSEFGAAVAAVADPAHLDALRARVPAGTTTLAGEDAAAAIAARGDVDVVVSGIVGRAGLESSLAAAEAGKTLALANKESLVLAGELLMATAARAGARVLPVDSEHSGLFQVLEGRPLEQVHRLIITASGGPFRGRRRADLDAVTPEEALRHPIWAMGPRITVDSATLFNKGLEVIETHHLFGVPLERIGVWVHPQSVIHALVELVDHTLIAQLAAPDMLIPVQYAMSWPERLPCAAPACSLPDWGVLNFEQPDLETFPALELAFRAARRGGTAPVALNAADEVAVELFLARRIPFPAIAEILGAVLETATIRPADSLAAIADADAEARDLARSRAGALR